MRTINEIVDAAKSNQPLSLDEARYCICALDALETFDRKGFMRLYEAASQKKPNMESRAIHECEENFRRWKEAIKVTPKHYLGWNNDPQNPDYQRLRGLSLKLWSKIAEKNATKPSGH